MPNIWKAGNNMIEHNNGESALRQSSRRLYAEIFSLKDTLYHDLLERFKEDDSIKEYEEKWKAGIMIAAASTALFSTALSGSKEYPFIYSFHAIKLQALFPGGEAALEDCMAAISKLLNGTSYHSGAFAEGLALWLYFNIKGKESFREEETLPFLLAGQYINQYYYNWFDKL
ncbi:hypothetical protein [Paenibacillus sinopodophylli]|uniref:hypothetical protein n=1 Tax=Paenibacillus sinopodophylli TaxID=1837342 RepID=UPI00110CD0BE|nr:hypothetical protein [Paenibacillus sinopodophylli]